MAPFTTRATPYWVSNAPESTSLEQLLSWAHNRWAIEQSYQQLKEELELNDFEGRSWRGLNHHIVLCFMACCFGDELKERQL